MKWRGRQRSRNVEDRRGQGHRRGRAAKTGGVGGVGLIVLLVVGYFLGVDVSAFLGPQGLQDTSESSPRDLRQDQSMGDFAAVVLRDTETVWFRVLEEQLGIVYTPPTLVLFDTVTDSPCGDASGATGPFYCPADRKAYLDTSFFNTLDQRLGADGDFAAAYVVAHEVAHHIQNELGFLPQANAERARSSRARANEISVMIELQADCFSGIWARYAEATLGVVEPGDIEEALIAARQIGDDTLARNAGRTPMPHTFTHGTSEQRMEWFARGYRTAELAACDTFGNDLL